MVCPPVCVEFVLLLLLVCFPVLLFPSLLEEGAADPKGKVLLLVGDPKSTGLWKREMRMKQKEEGLWGEN